jgi:hypothetical protein
MLGGVANKEVFVFNSMTTSQNSYKPYFSPPFQNHCFLVYQFFLGTYMLKQENDITL